MFKSIRQKAKKRLKEKKGSMLIEYVIGLLMLVVFVGFCLDLIFIGHKQYYIGQEMATISRVMSVQSGAEHSTPSGFPGGSKSYQTSSEILQQLEKVADAAGFKRSDWDLYIEEINGKGQVVRSGVLTENTDFKADYLDKISIEFRGTYHWDAISGAIPGLGSDRSINIKRISMAEYIRDYD